ncbi:hypothetical protein I5M27_04715 [Adhaeribacter sp. BT258]|uniref:Uncharacterized protein n=1 Tax=Adhaeribacter terrigena TaxID=2793070 RepID=A0ABS1BYP0_9BACT|nr:hypothetical protein [Adhaeribacter terrigena]MBK0402274.1 hypothetical protein [Adhaeribacter terrigena]
MKKKLLVALFILLTLGIGAYYLIPKVILMYACAEGGGKYIWTESRCIPYDELEKENNHQNH